MSRTTNSLRKAGRRNKREMLLQAAIEVFAKKGSNLATIADVAKKARVALGTVYGYFESKDDLLQNCMKEIIETEINEIINKTASIPVHMDRLYEFFLHHIILVKEKPYIARFLAVEVRQNENFSRRNPGYNPLHRYIDFVKQTAQQAITDAQIKPIDIEAFAYLLVGSMDLILWNWLAGGTQLNLETLSLQIRQILHAGVTLNPQD